MTRLALKATCSGVRMVRLFNAAGVIARRDLRIS